MCTEPQPTFAEAHCPDEWAACSAVPGCTDAVAEAIASPQMGSLYATAATSSTELLAVIACLIEASQGTVETKL